MTAPPPSDVKPVWEVPLVMPRHAFGPRDTARAGDLWRACQHAAVEGASLAGWTPRRFRAAGSAFIVRSMVAVHDRELSYGEQVRARTWVWRFRRDMLSTREVRLIAPDGPVTRATQEWVHIDRQLRPQRASAELIAAFPEHEEDASVALPEIEPQPGPIHRFTFECWHTWMDPLAHANHPAYIDWCDEGTSRVLASADLDPAHLVPVAERAVFRAGAVAGDEITVETSRAGVTATGDVVLKHRIRNGVVLCAETTTVRRFVDDTEALRSAFD